MSGSCIPFSSSGDAGVAGGDFAPSVCAGGGEGGEGEGEESSMKRIRPRTGFGLVVAVDRRDVSEEGGGGGTSRIQTAALLEVPEPRRMAGRPVDWMVRIIVDGGVVPIVVSMDLGREKVVEWIPTRIKLC